MGLFSGLFNVRVSAIKVLQNDEKKIRFLMATLDGFKERLFECVLLPVLPIDSVNDIKEAVEDIRSTRFYEPLDEIRDGVPAILRKHHYDSLGLGIGKLRAREFGPQELQMYGKSKQWFK